MSEKTFNTRIQHKHDTEANWKKATNFIPLQGELIVYDIDENYDYERFKIGDGIHNVNALPFANGVNSWNELKDRPFGEIWGDTFNFDYVAENDPNCNIRKISDYAVSIEELSDGIIFSGTHYGEPFTFLATIDDGAIQERSDDTIQAIVYFDDGTARIALDIYSDHDVYGTGIYLRGYYYTSYPEEEQSLILSVTIPGYDKFYSFKQIDKKFIPTLGMEDIELELNIEHNWDEIKNRPFGDFNNLEWDGEIGDKEFSEQGRGKVVKISDEIFTSEEILKGAKVTYTTQSGEKKTFVLGEWIGDYTLQLNVNSSYGYAFMSLYNPAHQADLVMCYTEKYAQFTPGVYFYTGAIDDGDIYVSNVEFAENRFIKKIDEKYLPDDIEDWDDIINKPFGITNILEWNGEIGDREVISYDEYSLVKISDEIIDYEAFTEETKITFVNQDGEYKTISLSSLEDAYGNGKIIKNQNSYYGHTSLVFYNPDYQCELIISCPYLEGNKAPRFNTSGTFFHIGKITNGDNIQVTKLEMPNKIFTKKIDSEYLPDISWEKIANKPFGNNSLKKLEWDGEISNKITGTAPYYENLIKVSDKTDFRNDFKNFKLYIKLETGETITAEASSSTPGDCAPLASTFAFTSNTNTGGWRIWQIDKDAEGNSSSKIAVHWSDSSDYYFKEPGIYFLKDKFKLMDGSEVNGYVCGLEFTDYKFSRTIAENKELLGRVDVSNGGVPETKNQPQDAILCNVDGTPTWKEIEIPSVVNDGQGLIELYDPKDGLFVWDTTNENYELSDKNYKVFDGELDINDYANGGAIIYETSTGLKIVSFITIDGSTSSATNLGNRMALTYWSDDPDRGFNVCATDYETGNTISGAHYYPKDSADRPAGLYFTWLTFKDNTFINVKGLYLNGCKKFIKIDPNYEIEYTDSFTSNGNIKDKPEMKAVPYGNIGYREENTYWISDAVFTADDFKNGCPCRFIDSTGLHSNAEWGTEWSCAVHEEDHYVDIFYMDENGNGTTLGYCCLEGSPYPPGFYMYNADNFKVLGFSVPGVKKFPKKKISKEELAHKGKTYSNSISWDYDMENRETYGYGFYKISDEHFTLEDLKDGYFVEYSPGSVYEDNYGYSIVFDETQCWAEVQGGCTNICTTDENGNTYGTIVSVPEGFLQSPGTYFYCDDWYYNAPYSLTIRGFKKFVADISSEEAVSPIAKKEKTNVLTWDGIITEPSNLHIIGWKEDESNYYWNYAFFYKVSDAIITLEDLKDGALTRTYSYEDSGWISVSFNENEIHLRKDGSIQIYCYDANGNHWDGADIFCYPENSTYPAGVYFGCYRDPFYSSYKLDDYVSGFEISAYKFNAVNKIDGKYLSDYNDIPNIPVGILPTGGDTLYWDGNTEGLESIENGTFFKVTDAFDPYVLSHAESIMIEYNPYPNGETIIEEASFIPEDDSHRLFKILGYDGEGNEHILAYVGYDGTYFANAANGYMYIHSLITPGFKKFPLLKKLDKKYLPDDIGVSSWNDLTDKPFGGHCNTLSWAGRGIDPTTLPAETWIKMSDAVVTMEDFGEVTVNDALFTFLTDDGMGNVNILSNTQIEAAPVVINENGILCCVVMDSTGHNYYGVEFRADGVYFFTGYDNIGRRAYPLSITIPDFGKFESFKPIDNRYMSEGLQVETVSLVKDYSVDIDSILDTNNIVIPSEAFSKNWLGQARMITDTNIPVKSCENHFGKLYYFGRYENNNGEYQIDAEEIETGFYRLGCTDIATGNTEFGGYCATDDSAYDTGVYLFDLGSGYITIHCNELFEVRTPKPIDKKYLPDDIGGGVSEEIVDDKIAEAINNYDNFVMGAIGAGMETVENKINGTFPTVTTSDNGKFLRVVNGVWAAVSLPNAEEVGF